MTTTQSDPRHGTSVTGANFPRTNTSKLAQESAGTLTAGETASAQLRPLDMLGAPLFLLRPGGKIKGKYAAPSAWERTSADDNDKAIRGWKPGYGVGMVCGQAYDVIDVDPRNGGDASLARMQEDGLIPPVQRVVKTPSGGLHLYVSPLGVRKATPLDGIDLQAQGSYVFAPPTEGYQELSPEAWPPIKQSPDGADLLRALVGKRSAAPVVQADARPYGTLSRSEQEQAHQRVQRTVKGFSDRLDAAQHWDDGHRDEQGRGWEKLTADAAFTLAQLGHAAWSPLSLADAEAEFAEMLPDIIAHDSKCSGKWHAQANRAASKPMPAPWQEDFEPVADDDPMLDGTPEPAEKDSPEDERERQVRAELERMVVREEARRRLAALNRVAPEMPAPIGLNKLLMAHLDAPRWRIADMWPAGGRVNLVASAKSGKTTTTGNIVRSLVDGEDFLGNETRPLGSGETVTIFDTEMTEVQLQDWYQDLGLRNADKVRIVSLVGRASGLNFLDQDALRTLVPQYAGSHTYILDPLGPVLSGLGLEENSNSEVQRFLSAWDTFVTLLGGQESMVTHHAGHSAERARGASAFIGSGSAIWTLVNKDPDDPMSDRYIKAIGRGVNVPETLLVHDPFTRRLSLGTGNRAQNKKSDKIDALADAIHQVVLTAPGITAGELEKRLRADGVSFQKGDVSKATALAGERGLIRVEQVKRAKHFHPSDDTGDSDLL